jgi:hypothetical protein
MLVERATTRPVCDALAVVGRHGIPKQVLTDNGKVRGGRVRLDRGTGFLGDEPLLMQLLACVV